MKKHITCWQDFTQTKSSPTLSIAFHISCLISLSRIGSNPLLILDWYSGFSSNGINLLPLINQCIDNFIFLELGYMLLLVKTTAYLTCSWNHVEKQSQNLILSVGTQYLISKVIYFSEKNNSLIWPQKIYKLS